MKKLLSELPLKTPAVISLFLENKIESSLSRLMEMGLTLGAEIEVQHLAPFGGTIAVQCRGTLIALRTEEAALIEVRVLGS